MEVSSSVIPQSFNPLKRPLTPAHQQAMILKFQGKDYPKIALELRLNVGTVRNWFQKTGLLYGEYQRYCNELMNNVPKVTNADARTVAERLKEAAPAALESIIDLSTNAKREQVKLAASADILDRAGYAPVQKLLNVHMIDEMDMTQLDQYVDNILMRHDKRALGLPVYKEGAHDTPTDTPSSEPIDVPDLTYVGEAVIPDVDEAEAAIGEHGGLEGGGDSVRRIDAQCSPPLNSTQADFGQLPTDQAPI